MSLLYYINIGVLVYGMIKTNTHVVIMDTITQKYKEWRMLNKTLDEMQVNKTRIAIKSVQLLLVYILTMMKQKYTGSVQRIKNTKMYELTYVINNKVYKQVVNPQRGPNPIISILNQDKLELFELIMPYIGPRYDWHYSELTPNFFGHESIDFIMLNGDSYTFNKNTVLSPVISFVDNADDTNVKSKTI